MTRFSINNDRIIYILLILLVFGGLTAYIKMPRAEDPGFVVRKSQVVTYFPGASPERVEKLVTDKLEAAIQEMPEVDFIASESRTGVSLIYVNVKERYKNMRPIWDSMRRKVDRVQATLPEGTVGPFVNDEFGDVYGTLLTLRGDGYSYSELKDIAETTKNQLLTINDVAKVEIRGIQEKRIFVDYQEAQLAELGLSTAGLRSILQSRNIIIPGGHVSNLHERMVVEPSGNFETIDDLRRTIITVPQSRQGVYLQDIATITEGYVDPPRSKVRFQGEPALLLAISLQDGGNIINLGRDVSRLVDQLRAHYPVGVEFEFAAFQPDVVKNIVDDFGVNLLESVGIVMVMMLISLGLRTGIIVASIIPFTILLSFLVMALFGIHLDQVSLAALVISLGLFVDNAIVMAESVMVEMKSGKRPKRAAIDAAKELNIPLLTSSLTTSAAFLPIFIARSSEGEYTSALFTVVTIALLSSWLLAMTVSPLLCSKFLRTPAHGQEDDTRFYNRYAISLAKVLEHKTVFLIVTGLVFAFSLYAFTWVPRSFFPPSERALVTMALELPPGSRFETLDEQVAQIERFLSHQSETRDTIAFIGESPPRFYLASDPVMPRPEYAFVIANAHSNRKANRLLFKAQNYLADEQIDLKATVRRLELGPPVTSPVEVRLSGDTDQVHLKAQQVMNHLRSQPGVASVSENWGRRVKKLVVDVDQPRALRAGITSQDVAVSLQTLLNGFETTQFRDEDDLIPVTMRLATADREDVERLETISIFSQTASPNVVPLSQVANVRTVWEPSAIHRRDRQRTVTVSAELLPGATVGGVISQLNPWLEKQEWPFGHSYALGGEKERSIRANKSIVDKIPIAAAVIVLLLVAQFNSIRKAAVILITIPFGLIGVVVGLLLTNTYLGFVTFLGVVSLAGIVVNNGIVLIDRIAIERKKGSDQRTAIIHAAQRRLRPILLTTATTVGGLIPLVISGGPLFQPMAIAVVSGLIVSTTLTLYLVPALYNVFYK